MATVATMSSREASPEAPLDVLVTGATGFIGRRLTPPCSRPATDVRAMTRNPTRTTVPARRSAATSSDPASLTEPLEGADVAVYLVHSLDSPDFEQRDADAARAFGKAAASAGVRQIVYIGGLGSEDQELSPHLRSRREVEGLLGEGGVPVTVLRAGIVVGDGGISWELTRQLVKNLPAMVVPRWVRRGPSRSRSTTWSATSPAWSATSGRSAGSSRSAAPTS